MAFTPKSRPAHIGGSRKVQIFRKNTKENKYLFKRVQTYIKESMRFAKS